LDLAARKVSQVVGCGWEVAGVTPSWARLADCVVIVEMEKAATSGANADVFAKLLGTAEAVPSQEAFSPRASSLKGFPRQALAHTKSKKEKATAPPIENRRKTHLSEP
jgi:hypothetical protein